MAPKKKSASTKKARTSSKKKSSGEGVSMGSVIVGASVMTLLIGGLIWWLFNRESPQLADFPPAPPADVKPSDAVAAPAPEAQNPAPQAAVSPPVASAPAAEGLVPLNVEWLPADANVVLRIRPTSLLNNPLVKPHVDSGRDPALNTALQFLRDTQIGDLESFSIGLAATPQAMQEFEKLQSGMAAGQEIPKPLVLVAEPVEEFVKRPDDNSVFEHDDDSGFERFAEEVQAKLPPLATGMRVMLQTTKMVFGHPATLKAVSSTAPAELAARFPPVPQNADFVLAMDLSVPGLLQQFAPPGPLAAQQQQQMQAFEEMKSKGVRSVAISLSLQNGISFFYAAQANSLTAVPEVRGLMENALGQIKLALGGLRDQLPNPAKKYLDDFVAGMKLYENGTAVSFSITASPELVRMVQNEGPALLGMMMAPQLAGGPGMPAPGSLGAGGAVTILSEPLLSATEATGMPGDMKLSTAVSWDAAGAQASLQVPLAIAEGGLGAKVVQYRRLVLNSATNLQGGPLKPYSHSESPFVVADSWQNVQSAMLGAQGSGVLIPLSFEPTGEPLSGIAKLEGEFEIRSASAFEEHQIPASATGVFNPAAFEPLGVRLVAGTGSEQGTIFVFPASEELALLEVVPGAEKLQTPAATPAVVPAMTPANPVPAEPVNQEPDPVPMDPVDDVDGDGLPDNPDRRPEKDPVVTIAVTSDPLPPMQSRRYRSWSPRGYQVSVQGANHLTLRVAKNLTTSQVTFKFANLPVPSPAGASASSWVTGQDLIKLPDGLTGVYVRALRWDPPQAESRLRRLVMQMEVTGPVAGRIVSLGGDRVDEAKGDDGKSLSLDEKAPSFLNRPRGFDVVPLSQRDKLTPLDSFRFEMPLQVTDPTLSKISIWSGRFQVKVAKGHEDVVISNPAPFVGKRILHDSLLREKINIRLEQPTGKLIINVPQAARESVLWVELLNRAGDPLVQSPPTINRTKLADQYEFAMGAGVPALPELQLRVIINTQLTTLNIPVKFENIPVPKP